MNYTGNKAIPGILQTIVNNIPEHKYFYELFAGSAAIAKEMPVDKTAIFLNDLNKKCFELWKLQAPTVKSSIDAINIIRLLKHANKHHFIFLDPPYRHNTRNNTKLYDFEMTDYDHLQLLKALQEIKCNCMIIHPDDEMYNAMLPSWYSLPVKIRYNNKTSYEKIYMNYSKPDALQTFKHIGKDCWDRQRIKRKAIRIQSKGLLLPFPGGTYIEHMLHSNQNVKMDEN